MTPLEELQAAHKRLSEMNAVSTGGPWIAVLGPRGWDIDSSVTGEACADDMIQQDADLIVTLHRTIDAQLVFLEYAARVIADESDAAISTALVPYELGLARAINGEVTDAR